MDNLCKFCGFFNEKSHCSNCKLYKKVERLPKELDISLDDFVNKIKENNGDDFVVGDYIKIELLTGEIVKAYIIGKHHDVIDDDRSAPITMGVLAMDGKFEMNEENTNSGGYDASKMRNVYLPRIYKLLPDKLKEIMVCPQKKTYVDKNNFSLIKEDKLFLFSRSEIIGNESDCDEGLQYEFFEKKEYKFPYYTWLRSPYTGSNNRFWNVANNGNVNYHGYAYNSLAVAFGFCLKSQI